MSLQACLPPELRGPTTGVIDVASAAGQWTFGLALVKAGVTP